jgi:hypothetical protein
MTRVEFIDLAMESSPPPPAGTAPAFVIPAIKSATNAVRSSGT